MHAAHDHDDISIRIIQICDRTLLKSLFVSNFSEIFVLRSHMEKV